MADLLLLCFLKRLIGHEFISVLLTMEMKKNTAQVSHETLSTHEFDKQTEGRYRPHLTHLSTEAPGSTLTPFHCHNICIPTRDTAQARL